MRDLAYLRLLAREYPNVQAASSEIINLMAIRGLPKGTEYFFSDLHGEYEAFVHLLRSASGIIREKISETFGYVISDEDEIALANLIYYPERGLRAAKRENRFHRGLAEAHNLPRYASVKRCRPNTPDPRCVRKCRRRSLMSSTS